VLYPQSILSPNFVDLNQFKFGFGWSPPWLQGDRNPL
jgi:hypothetical protein